MPFWFVLFLLLLLFSILFAIGIACGITCLFKVTYTKVKGRSPPVRWKEYVFGLAFLVTLLFVAAFCL